MFDKLFGIDDLEQDINQFYDDISTGKETYITEYTEYLDIITNFENIEQKHDFLVKETEALKEVFFEDEGVDGTLSDISSGFMYSASILELIAIGSYIAKRFYSWKLTKVLAKIDNIADLVRNLANSGDTASDIARLGNLADAALASKLAKTAKIAKAARIAKVTSAVGAILGIVSFAVDIASAAERKKYLEEQKDDLNQSLEQLNGYIAEANEETKNIINAFLSYFNELEIDVSGVFNDNKDGISNETSFNSVVEELRSVLNGSIKRMGELNASITLGNKRMDRYISRGYEGQELIEEVAWDTELPEEMIRRLYIIKLREAGKNVQEAIDLSQSSEDIVRKLYALGYLEDGKTVEDTVQLSGLTEEEVRRVYASKLLDDQLNTENPDDVLDMTAIAKEAGLSEEIVREIRAEKLQELLNSSQS